MTRIKIDDLDVDLDALLKKDPKILAKIRGGYAGLFQFHDYTMQCIYSYIGCPSPNNEERSGLL